MIFVGGGNVVEALLTDGVREVPLSEAIKDADLAVGLRYPDLSAEQAQDIVLAAKAAVGKRYDRVGAASEARVTLGSQSYSLDLGSEDGLYCSSLVVDVFKKAGAALVLQDPRFAAPNDIAVLNLVDDLVYVGHLKSR